MLEDNLVSFANRSFECVDQGFNQNEPVEVIIRPEDLEITTAELGKITVQVDSILFRGVHYEMSCYDEFKNEWLVHSTKKVDVNSKIGLNFGPEAIHIMRLGETEAEFDKRLEAYEE